MKKPHFKAHLAALVVGALFLASSTAPLARAEGGGSTGGGISVMHDGKVQLLDLVEAKPIQVERLPEFAELKRLLTELRLYNQTLADSILGAVHDHELYFYFTPFELIPTGDSRAMIEATDIQEAAQRGPVVVINEGHWQQADASHRVGLLLHEIVLHANFKADRMMLRRVVDRIMTRDFGDERSFTMFLSAMGLNYPAGATPLCQKAYRQVDARVAQYLTSFRTWAQNPATRPGRCVPAKAEFVRKLDLALLTDLPPGYCSSDAMLIFHDAKLAMANLELATVCVKRELTQ